jgi:hypothetical protein
MRTEIAKQPLHGTGGERFNLVEIFLLSSSTHATKTKIKLGLRE